jgi:hypothetical protein
MSINSLTNAALARRRDYTPANRPPRTARERAAATSTEPIDENRVSIGLKSLTTYIPTEILTLYVALVAALQPGTNSTTSFVARWIAFAAFFVLTPVAIWAAFASKLASDNKELPVHPHHWPMWEMFAGTLAYVAWTIGLPDTPFAQIPWFTVTLGGFVILATSTLLGMVAGLFQRELPATDPVPAVEATAEPASDPAH